MADFPAVEARLRSILEPYRDALSVTKEGADGMVLELPGYEGKPWGYVAGTQINKSYVSFHLMSVYTDPTLMASMSTALRKRMQGKSCFNFTKIDEPLFEELTAITAKGVARHEQMVGEAIAAKASKAPGSTRTRSRGGSPGS